MASVRGVQGGEVENLEPWIDPIIPGPAIYTVPPQYEDGLDQIDKLGAWDCALSSFNPMDGVPHLHRGKWVWAMSGLVRHKIDTFLPDDPSLLPPEDWLPFCSH